MKIVLDTNVLISGIFFSGPPHRILKAWHKVKSKLPCHKKSWQNTSGFQKNSQSSFRE